jgi:Zn ribbon nucleic-acid-binding protein
MKPELSEGSKCPWCKGIGKLHEYSDFLGNITIQCDNCGHSADKKYAEREMERIEREEKEKIIKWFKGIEKFSPTVQALLIHYAIRCGYESIGELEEFGKWAVKNVDLLDSGEWKEISKFIFPLK